MEEKPTTQDQPENGSATTLAAPVCPGCKADPLIPIGRTFNMGPFTILLTFCAACRYPVPAILLEIAQPQIAVPQKKSPFLI